MGKKRLTQINKPCGERKKKHIMKYHFTPTGMTIIKTDNDRFGQGNGKLELAHTAGGNVKRRSLFGKLFVRFLKS